MRKALGLLLFLALPAAADDTWKYSLTPYLWLPTLNSKLNYELPPDAGGGRFNVEIGPNDYLSHLKFALLLSGDMRKQRYSFVSDAVYLSLGHEESSISATHFPQINRDTTTSFKALMWTVAGGYSVNPDVDLIAGVRYLGVDTRAQWQLTTGFGNFPPSGSIAKNVDLFDGILGVRGRAKLGERWHLPYYADVGAGSSKVTWQAMTGVTYSYNWGDIGVVYRHVAYQQKQPDLLKNLSLSGPAFTFTFHF